MNWLVLAGSLAGVLGLVFIAWLLGLGGAAIAGEAEAKRSAEDSHAGFAADQAFVSSDGKAALVRGRDATWILLKVHGANLAARRLQTPLPVSATEDGVIVASGERMFGDVRLKLSVDARDRLLAIV